MFFWNSLAFLMSLWMLAIWSLVPLPFLFFFPLFFFLTLQYCIGFAIYQHESTTAFSKTSLTSGSSWFMYYWSLAWRILSITLLVCGMSAIMRYFECSLALPFLELEWKFDIFQSYGHCWVFQICWHIECSTFTASSFRIWNSSTGIPSPPLACS